MEDARSAGVMVAFFTMFFVFGLLLVALCHKHEFRMAQAGFCQKNPSQWWQMQTWEKCN